MGECMRTIGPKTEAVWEKVGRVQRYIVKPAEARAGGLGYTRVHFYNT